MQAVCGILLHEEKCQSGERTSFMKLSDNERVFLEAIRDNCFNTIAQVTQHCGFQRAMGYHYFRSLSLGGLIDGFELTYAGHKVLAGEDLLPGDDETRFDIRIPKATEHRID